MKKTFMLLAMCCRAALASPSDEAEQMVKNQPCKEGETVAQYLEHKLSSSHRDLGWRVYTEEDGIQVERAFLVSKSMELRYRWRVESGGAIRPVSERAAGLCS